MNNVHFRSNGFIICKRTDRVDCGMDNNTRKQASAAIKDRDRQEADRDGEGNLQRLPTRSIPLPLNRLIICPMPKVTLEIMTADLILPLAIALNRSPRKITSSGNPTQSIHRMRQTVSAGS